MTWPYQSPELKSVFANSVPGTGMTIGNWNGENIK